MTGLFIIARLGSTRLEKKHLIEVNGKTFIEWLSARYLVEFAEEIKKNEIKIFILTSIKPENKSFAFFFADTPVEVFYGDDENIPLRQLQCAEANNIDVIVPIDGDDVLCSTHAARMAVDELLKGFDIVQTTGLPLGMNVSAYTTAFLKRSLEKQAYKKLETGWGKIFENGKKAIKHFAETEHAAQLRMTLDYPEDAHFFEKVINGIGENILTIPDNKLVEIILANNWNTVNESLSEAYWENFNKNKQSETE